MTLPTSKQPAQCIRLIELPAGATGRICSLDGDANLNARLREMGIGESAVLEKISGQHTLLCRLRDVRIALNRQAAQHIWVEKIDPK